MEKQNGFFGETDCLEILIIFWWLFSEKCNSFGWKEISVFGNMDKFLEKQIGIIFGDMDQFLEKWIYFLRNRSVFLQELQTHN